MPPVTSMSTRGLALTFSDAASHAHVDECCQNQVTGKAPHAVKITNAKSVLDVVPLINNLARAHRRPSYQECPCLVVCRWSVSCSCQEAQEQEGPTGAEHHLHSGPDEEGPNLIMPALLNVSLFIGHALFKPTPSGSNFVLTAAALV